MNLIEKIKRWKNRKPLQYPEGIMSDNVYCPNCNRFLEENEQKALKISHGAGDVDWIIKDKCGECGANYKKDTYSKNAFGGPSLEVMTKWRSIH